MYKNGSISDYNLVCPECGATYYERPRCAEEIIKSELFYHGRVRRGHGPAFIPECPGCRNTDYYRFTADDLKPRNKKAAGMVIAVKKGDVRSSGCGFTFVKLDWGVAGSDEGEKSRLVEGLKRIKGYCHLNPMWIYANFPERKTAIHFHVSRDIDPMETISVFGRVSMEDARAFVKELLEMAN